MPSRCPICPGDFLPIAGSGPRQSMILWIGERPGSKENERQQVFCGPTGEELDETYMRLAGLSRYEQRVENCVRCWAHNNRTPTDKEVDSCSRHFLPQVLAECRPDIVVLLGGRACRIADRHLRIDTHHGSPYYGSILGGTWEGMVWPSYHPALGMHDTSKMSQLLEDFEKLGLWLEGKWTPPTALVDPSAPLDYRLVKTQADLDEYLDCMPAVIAQGCDTENHGPKPFSVQFSHTPGTGRMILAEDKGLIAKFGEFARVSSTEWLFHNAPHDLDVGDQMGVQFPLYRDTQQEAYHQCSLPQGLKALAYQLLGVEMHSWEDTVWPASIKALQAWMEEAYGFAQSHMQVEKRTPMQSWLCSECLHLKHFHKKCKQCGCDRCEDVVRNEKVEMVSGAVESILKHVLKHLGTQDEESESEYDPFKKLKQFWQDGLRGKRPLDGELQWLEERLGPVPILGIGNCVESEAVRYGVGDADMTLQVGEELERRRDGGQGGRWAVMEGDVDQ